MDNRVKIVHITPAAMSLEVLLKDRFARLSDLGYESIGYSGSDQYSGSFRSSGFEFIESRHLTRRSGLLSDLKFFMECIRVLRSKRPSIVNTYGPKPGLYGRIASKLAGIPVTVHTSWGFFYEDDAPLLKRLPIVILEVILSFFCDHIFSENMDDLMVLRKWGIGEKKASYLGNGTDVNNMFDPDKYSEVYVQNLKEELGIKGDAIVISMIGRLTAQKGYREFFYAADHFGRADGKYEFVVIGPMDSTKGDGITEEEIASLERNGTIRYLGSRDHSEMPGLLSLADIVVLPSYREGFPRSLIEAASMGKPLVASRIRGCREAVDDGYNGILVPAKDPEALVDAIGDLLRNPGKRERLATASREKAINEFDEVDVVSRMDEIYRRLLANRSRRSGT
ncbi:MAG: glycosyltransferase family 4 protein [Nitrospirota bacterium]|nr:MAG: glycosyltransferase family 4 protein [Nitrospirota bacterium]